MVLKLYRNKACIRTIFNVTKISNEEHGVLIVTNKSNHILNTKEYYHLKDYRRFIITVD